MVEAKKMVGGAFCRLFPHESVAPHREFSGCEDLGIFAATADIPRLSSAKPRNWGRKCEVSTPRK